MLRLIREGLTTNKKTPGPKFELHSALRGPALLGRVPRDDKGQEVRRHLRGLLVDVPHVDVVVRHGDAGRLLRHVADRHHVLQSSQVDLRRSDILELLLPFVHVPEISLYICQVNAMTFLKTFFGWGEDNATIS
jgi:hypothetical protein